MTQPIEIDHEELAKVLLASPALLARLVKSSPGVADVHVPSAGGSKRKARSFKDAMKEPPARRSIGKAGRFEARVDVMKADAEQRMVFGWASVSMIGDELIVDKQDDIIEIEELEKAAYDFVLYARRQGDMHVRKDVGRLVESLVFTKEKSTIGLVAKTSEGKPVYGWWVGFKVDDDDLWKDHKEGRRPEFSIGGRSTAVEV